MTFRDRADAGRRLARCLEGLRLADPVVLALPRGGVPVGAEVARVLRAPLDVLPARKIGAPAQPELAVGALAEGGEPVWNDTVLARLGLAPYDLAGTVARERAELVRRVARYRAGHPRLPVVGRTAVVVDDGLATGATARAALGAVRARRPARLVLAVPVAARESVLAMRADADDVVAVEVPADFRAVGGWYDDFTQVSDEEVMDLLAAPADPRGDGAGAGAVPDRVASADAVAGQDPDAPSADRPRTVALRIDARGVALDGDLTVPTPADGLVLFAHGSGSSRHSPRNRLVASELRTAGFATLLLDLLTAEEESGERAGGGLRFDVPLLADRLVAAVDAVAGREDTRRLPVGVFGASTGAGAAVVAAASRPHRVRAVVSRGGRPDLAWTSLAALRAPTLLIVGGDDGVVLELNRQAAAAMTAEHRVEVIPGAGHLFEEPGALETVGRLAARWFRRFLPRPPAA